MPEQVRYRDLEQTILVKMFGYSPKVRILDIFLDNPYFDFSKSEVVKELGMSKQTFYKHFKDLEELGVVEVSRRIGRATMYRISRQHPLIRRLDEIITEISLRTAEKEAEKQVKAVPVKQR